MHLLKIEKQTALGGHCLFLALLAMSIGFWQERTIILDAAFQSYQLICDGKPAIMVQRFGVLPIQLLPLIGVWFGFSLSKVLVLFSLSYVLFQWLLFSLCLHGLRNSRAATAIALFNILLTGDCFYWIQNELLPAISLLFVLLALAEKQTQERYSLLLHIVLAFLAITIFFLHPLIIFPLGFVLVFFWFDPASVLSKKILIHIFAFLGLAFVLKYVVQAPNFYDRGMTGQFVREFEPAMLFDLPKSNGFGLFWAHLDDSMLLFLPICLLLNIVFIFQQKLFKALIFNVFIIIYSTVLFVRFREDTRWYIIESHLQALSVFMLLPLLWDLVPGIRFRYLGWLLALIVGLRLWGIFQNHIPYSARLAYIKDLVQQAKGPKTMLRPDQVDIRLLMMTWGLPFETLHASALLSPDAAKVMLVVPTPGQETSPPPADSMPTFLQLPRKAFKDLPKNYFKIEEGEGYQ